MKFLIDNALSPQIAQILRDHGHDAVHVRDLGLNRASDEIIIELALKQERILLSADTDFGTLLALWGRQGPSFILLRESDKNPHRQAARIIENLPFIQNDLRQGAIVVFEDHRIRIRKLPIGSSPAE